MVPAPSRLAQRDVAKTHVSPGPCPRAPGAKPKFWVTFTWRTCRFGGCESANRQPKNYTRSGWISQARLPAHDRNKYVIYLSLRGVCGGGREIKKGPLENTFLGRNSCIFVASDAHGHDDVAVAV